MKVRQLSDSKGLSYLHLVMLSLYAILLGVLVGLIDAVFGRVLIGLSEFRDHHLFYLVPALPLAGLLIVYLYQKFAGKAAQGMGLIFKVGHNEEDQVPLRLIPLVTVTTWLTHLFGGSAGREGVAVQLGATVSHAFSRYLDVYKRQAGTLMLTSGQIFIMGEEVAALPAEKRAKHLSRVFQDPKMGTAPRMTVAENLLIAKYRGEKRGLKSRHLHLYTEEFQGLIERISNGLEKHLETPAGLLSGGQRQALSLLMATLKRPELLLLDEHTAALDPKTSVALMKLTDEFVTRDHLTALMITHHMEDALKYGNRLIVMKDGQIIKDLTKEEKDQLDITDYYAMFE